MGKANKLITLKTLVELTGAPPYIIKYLNSCRRLPVIQNSKGQGYPVIYSAKAVKVVKGHLERMGND